MNQFSYSGKNGSRGAAKNLKADLLACPFCLDKLRLDHDALTCTGCDRRFSVLDGVPCFSATNDFYDAYADNGFSPYKNSPPGAKGLVLRFLPFWSWREWRFWRAVVPKCDRLLDLGCGRGRQLFAERSRYTVGFDSAIGFARECANHYDLSVVGNFPNLPFPSESFEAVVSSHVMGHVPVELKDKLLEEIARILRPGGVTAHIIETDSAHPAVVAAKSKPDAYREKFIDQHGHIGLELADLALRRFEAHGFRIRELRLVDAIVPSVLNIRNLFSHADFANVPELKWSRRFDRWTASSFFVNAGYEVGMGIFHRTFEQWFGNPRNAQFILVAFDKVA
jgi:SAM-dependent methyltransferase